MQRMNKGLLTPEFAAKQEQLNTVLRPLRGKPSLAARAREYVTTNMPESELERDALWWTCVLQHDMDSFFRRHDDESLVFLAGWHNDEDFKAKAIVLCPDYRHLATRMVKPHCETKDADWHEGRFRALHDYLRAARLLPPPLEEDPAPGFRDTLTKALSARMKAEAETSMDTHSIRELEQALRYLQGYSVLLLAMCGHGAAARYASGQAGVFMLAGGGRLTDDVIANALRNFKGTLILAYCMCHAAVQDPAGSGAASIDGTSPLHELAKQCCIVRIYSCERDETLFPSQAHTFTSLLECMVREAPRYEGLQDWVDEKWPECRPLEELPGEWRPAPRVSCTPPCTGRFLEPAAPM